MNIVCWSGGKDSTATIILAKQLNIEIDYIVFSEVMFDKNISGENPRHIDFVKNKAKPLFESWGYKVIILHSDKTYMDLFHRIMKNPRKHMEHRGMKHGFALTGFCNVKRDLKIKPIDQFLKSIKEPYTEFIGICADEKKRLESLYKTRNRSLLAELGYTEKMALELCKEWDLLSPTYELSKRGGCFFCPFAKLAEHREIKELYPDVWQKFIALENEENVAFNKWSIYGETLKERDEQLEREKHNSCTEPDKTVSMFDYIRTDKAM